MQGKGKQPKARTLAVPTRKGKQPKEKKSELLCSAVLAVKLQPEFFTPSQQAVYAWSISHMLTLAKEA